MKGDIQEEILDGEVLPSGATSEGVVIDGKTVDAEEAKPTVVDLAVKVESKVIATNLDKFKQDADTFLASLTTKLETDDDFENAKAEVKLLKEIEDKTKSAIQAVINNSADISALVDTANEYIEKFRTIRLSKDKQVKADWAKKKTKVTSAGKVQVRTALNAFSEDVKKALEIALSKDGNDIETQVDNASKNKRTLASLQKSINAEVNGLIAEITQQGAVINNKLQLIEPDFKYLFQDAYVIVLEDNFEEVVTERLNKEAERLEVESIRKQKEEDELAQQEAQKAELIAQQNAQQTQEQRRSDLRSAINPALLEETPPAGEVQPEPESQKPEVTTPQPQAETYAVYFTADSIEEAKEIARTIKAKHHVVKLTKVEG